MHHTKFRENRPALSGEEDFLVFFTIYGRGGHLGHVTSAFTSGSLGVRDSQELVFDFQNQMPGSH